MTRVKTDRELVAAADENFIASFRTLADHVPDGVCRESPGLFAFATGLPIALFNGCVVTGPVAAEDLDSAVAWVKERGAPFRIWVSERLGAERAHLGRAPGLAAQAAPYPGMTLHPAPDPPAPPADVTVVPVGADGFEEFLGVLVDAGLERHLALRLLPPGFVADPAVALFVGRLDGDAVGTSLAIRSDTASRRVQRRDPRARSSARRRHRPDLGCGGRRQGMGDTTRSSSSPRRWRSRCTARWGSVSSHRTPCSRRPSGKRQRGPGTPLNS